MCNPISFKLDLNLPSEYGEIQEEMWRYYGDTYFSHFSAPMPNMEAPCDMPPRPLRVFKSLRGSRQEQPETSALARRAFHPDDATLGLD